MASDAKHPLLQYVHKAALALGDSVSDGQLLESFVLRRDEEAFAVLVQRHGSMVMGVCQRVLVHSQDAEDAFQATFLVLARKASSVTPREKVGHWLYGVAYRTALEARTARARRRAKEAAAPVRSEEAGSDPVNELRGELDRQLNGLPEKYRLPVLLCDLQGKTQQEAARQLGWPEGTVSGRLFRARQLLATRLKHRGVAITAVSLPALLSQQALAIVPLALTSATVKVSAGGPALAATVTETVNQLTEGVLRTMWMKRMKNLAAKLIAASLLLALACTLTMQLLAAYQAAPQNPIDAGNNGPAGAAAQPKPTPKPTPKPLTADETFQQMEAALTKANTIQCTYDTTTKSGDKSVTMKGKLWVGGQNKFRLEMNADLAGKGNTMFALISDGNQFASMADKEVKPGKLAKNMDKNIALMLARSGLSLPLYAIQETQPNGQAPANEPDVAKLYQVSEFKLGKPEDQAGGKTAVVHYQLKMALGNMTMKTTVWIDPKSNLPLKRVLTPEMGGNAMTITETYTAWALNKAIAPDTFKIPAK